MGGQGKRKQIMEAAIRLFAEEGFEAASMQDIANAAEVAKGTMYLYFPSKEELIAQVYRHCYRMDVEACNAGLDEEGTALDKLCRRLDNIMDFTLSHPLESDVGFIGHKGFFFAIGILIDEGFDADGRGLAVVGDLLMRDLDVIEIFQCLTGFAQ